MATERDFELLDDYLANRLSGAEKSSFENKLQADPDLQGELAFQKSLVEGIKKSRAAELKSMLQNIPVGAPTAQGMSTGAKVALSSFVAVVISAGVYFYITKDTSEAQSPTSQETEQPANGGESTESQSSPEISAESDKEPAEASRQTERKSPSTTTEPVSPQPTIDVFDPTEDDGETAVAADESPRTSSDNGGSALAVEIDRAHSEYRFHYQFRDGKLFLYGPFENNLYEIMEFISDDKTTMFLYHKNSYYLLKDDSDRIKPLSAITDQVLLRKLKEYQKH